MRTRWLCCFLLLTVDLYGQVDRGALTGTVRDPSGLGVPGASVAASQNGTGLSRVAVTSSSGTYDIPMLPVGTYTVTFALKGFQTASFENLAVGVEHTTTLNAVLQVSGTTERIEVTASTQQLDESSNTLGATVERKQVTELLLNGRNWATLTALAPLAVDTDYNSSSNQRSIRVAGRGRDELLCAPFHGRRRALHDDFGAADGDQFQRHWFGGRHDILLCHRCRQ